MRIKIVILITLLVALTNSPAAALNIGLESQSGDDELSLDNTAKEFTLNLVFDSVPVVTYLLEKRFTVPAPFDLIGVNDAALTVQDRDSYIRILGFSLPDPMTITKPLIATLSFSIAPNALPGDYYFTQQGGEASNGWADMGEDGRLVAVRFEPNSFHISLERSKPIPEPTTMLLFATGITSVFASRFRQKRN